MIKKKPKKETKKARKALPKISTLKKKAWKLTSEYVRLSVADHAGYVSCVTCGATRKWNDSMQAGHWIPQKTGNATRYDLRNIHVQCAHCNLSEGGSPAAYALFMENTYSRETREDLVALSRTIKQFKRSDYMEIIEYMASGLAHIALNPGEREPSEIQEWQRHNVS